METLRLVQPPLEDRPMPDAESWDAADASLSFVTAKLGAAPVTTLVSRLPARTVVRADARRARDRLVMENSRLVDDTPDGVVLVPSVERVLPSGSTAVTAVRR